MKLSKHTFQYGADLDFFKCLHKRVNSYFTDKNKSRYGGNKLIFKMLIMTAIFILPYIAIVGDMVNHAGLFLLLWILMGLGVAGLGMNVMHDANHGVFSRHKRFNKVVRLVMNILGGDAAIWRFQHNVLHHSYTNIHLADEDISDQPLLRFSPHHEKKSLYRYQFIYAWVLYGFMTLIKVAYTDFKRALRYRKIGLVKSKKELTVHIARIAGGKLMYFAYMLVVPMIFVSFSPWLVLLGFFLMHVVTGFVLSIIFQTAHVMPSSEYPLPNEEGEMENNWAVHQMLTTSNFSPKSKFFFWLIGGLNFQIEHHLFSNISHIHYRDISRIVMRTAQEFNIPYHCQKTFASALRQHGNMLYQLGQ